MVGMGGQRGGMPEASCRRGLAAHLARLDKSLLCQTRREGKTPWVGMTAVAVHVGVHGVGHGAGREVGHEVGRVRHNHDAYHARRVRVDSPLEMREAVDVP